MHTMYSKLSNKVLVRINKVNKYIVKVSIYVIIINNINKEESALTLLQEIELNWVEAIDDTPMINPGLESLLFPDKESFMINHSWLDYFLSFKNTPCYCIYIIWTYILILLTAIANSLKCYHLIFIQVFNQRLDHLSWNKELNIGFLVYISILRSPSEFRVCWKCSINLRLWVNCEYVVLVNLYKFIKDHISL
jgi:hypothetical protein